MRISLFEQYAARHPSKVGIWHPWTKSYQSMSTILLDDLEIAANFDGFGSSFGLKLREDIGYVCFDGAFGYKEILGNLIVGEAIGNEFEDLVFLFCEYGVFWWCRLFTASATGKKPMEQNPYHNKRQTGQCQEYFGGVS